MSHRSRQAKFANGDLILSLSQFLLLAKRPLKMTLATKRVKINLKTVILLPWSTDCKIIKTSLNFSGPDPSVPEGTKSIFEMLQRREFCSTNPHGKWSFLNNVILFWPFELAYMFSNLYYIGGSYSLISFSDCSFIKDYKNLILRHNIFKASYLPNTVKPQVATMSNVI